MAPNMDYLCRDLAGYLSARLPVPVQAKIDIPWQERERMLDAGEIGLCWICGLPYVWKADRMPRQVEPFVAPIMSGSRYQNRPIYFSDVVVRQDSAITVLDELRGTTWAYNEPSSHSGYGVVRYMLAQRGETLKFFGRVIESGTHQNSIQMILHKEVDAAAVDSTVLEQELLNDPAIGSQIRVIDTFGPSPIPPWVISHAVPNEIQQRIREVFLGMEMDPEGQTLLHKARMARFTAVDDDYYDLIREMARVARLSAATFTDYEK